MQVIHRREPGVADAQKIAWLSELTGPFALVLVQSDNSNSTPLGSFDRIGVACGRREEIDEQVAIARHQSVLHSNLKYPLVTGHCLPILMVIRPNFHLASRTG